MESTTKRGYGSAHQRERKRWEAKVEAGGVKCARCGKPIEPGQPFDLGHNDDRTGYFGAECVPCNRGAGARNATAARIANRQTTTRAW